MEIARIRVKELDVGANWFYRDNDESLMFCRHAIAKYFPKVSSGASSLDLILYDLPEKTGLLQVKSYCLGVTVNGEDIYVFFSFVKWFDVALAASKLDTLYFGIEEVKT